ncbi:hypothetical protein BJY04DRAFT_219746 [Aspergillus karnatakaensis]|uniref:uncharacterized protein n=1 Tax=Aspergillus karnatakaensis TaxID=1810916 RepID=UPI003CCD15DD
MSRHTLFQFVSAAYGVGATDSILNNLLLRNIPNHMPGVNPDDVLNAGSSGLQDVFQGDEPLGARQSYLKGLQGSWALGVALLGVTFLCALIPEKGGRLAGPPSEGEKSEERRVIAMAV